MSKFDLGLAMNIIFFASRLWQAVSYPIHGPAQYSLRGLSMQNASTGVGDLLLKVLGISKSEAHTSLVLQPVWGRHTFCRRIPVRWYCNVGLKSNKRFVQ